MSLCLLFEARLESCEIEDWYCPVSLQRRYPSAHIRPETELLQVYARGRSLNYMCRILQKSLNIEISDISLLPCTENPFAFGVFCQADFRKIHIDLCPLLRILHFFIKFCNILGIRRIYVLPFCKAVKTCHRSEISFLPVFYPEYAPAWVFLFRISSIRFNSSSACSLWR